MKHRIIYEAAPEARAPKTMKAMVKAAITAALDAEQVDVPCEINVLLTNDDGVHQLNYTMRGVDCATDVLSFPMFQLSPGEKPSPSNADPGTGLVPLGDIVLSLERARQQAKEFGHSLEREVSYLAVHSVLHLLGYDHLDEGPKKAQMRQREEAVLERLGVETKKGEAIMNTTGKKVVLTKIEPEASAPETEAGLRKALAPLVVTGAVFGTTLALCRRAMKHFPFKGGR